MAQIRFTSLTLFPEMFASSLLNEGVLSKALSKNIIAVDTVFLRDFAHNSRKNVDDHPYGGGDGMILRPDIADRAILSVKTPESFIVHLTPAGKVFNHSVAKQLSQKQHIIFLCGRYGGYDARVVA
ncbi:MAG: hypothetical protein K2X39_06710, partial [Silvanigrellaceae bacterium]|nr:hypothetical protein [Silvanigrellaceae bacterium]